MLKPVIKLLICCVGDALLQIHMLTRTSLSGRFFVLGGESVIRIRRFHRARIFYNLDLYSFAKQNNIAVRVDCGVTKLKMEDVCIQSWRAKDK